eukprot:jgi/Chlat1/5767/Chrsp387S05493
MAAAAAAVSVDSWVVGSPLRAASSVQRSRPQRRRPAVVAAAAPSSSSSSASTDRRSLLVGAASLAAAFSVSGASVSPASAVQGLTAGRVPGLGKPDADGYRWYVRPEGKSGGHGIGWSELEPYRFRVGPGWEEVSSNGVFMSIADLGGTEIDARFENPDQGRLALVAAPLARFADNAEAELVDLGDPLKIITAFGPELFGTNVDEKVVYSESVHIGDRDYYRWELSQPHALVAAATGSKRLYFASLTANTRQWKRAGPELRKIIDSFRVGFAG